MCGKTSGYAPRVQFWIVVLVAVVCAFGVGVAVGELVINNDADGAADSDAAPQDGSGMQLDAQGAGEAPEDADNVSTGGAATVPANDPSLGALVRDALTLKIAVDTCGASIGVDQFTESGGANCGRRADLVEALPKVAELLPLTEDGRSYVVQARPTSYTITGTATVDGVKQSVRFDRRPGYDEEWSCAPPGSAICSVLEERTNFLD